MDGWLTDCQLARSGDERPLEEAAEGEQAREADAHEGHRHGLGNGGEGLIDDRHRGTIAAAEENHVLLNQDRALTCEGYTRWVLRQIRGLQARQRGERGVPDRLGN